MGQPEWGAPAIHASSKDSGEDHHLTSAQLLRRHAQDLIETAERMLAQAEAELERASALVGGAGFGQPASESGRS